MHRAGAPFLRFAMPRMQRRSACFPARAVLVLLVAFGLASGKEADSEKLESSYNESRRAYDAFSIVLAGNEGELDLSRGAKSHTVFQRGRIMDPWYPPKKSPATPAELARLFHHDAYADRISFELFYGDSDRYEYTMPEVLVSDKRIADPKVVEYRNDVDENSAGFSILYDCKPEEKSVPTRSVVVSVIVPVISGISVLISMVKTCGGGMHPYIEFGHYRDAIDSRLGATRVQFGTGSFEAGPHVMSTRLYLHLHRPAQSQEFFHPTINTSSSVLSLTMRGPKFGGILRGGESTILHVLYECLGKGKSVITAYVRITPFQALRARWTKDCGGGKPVHLSIGSNSFESADVVQTGTVSRAWFVDVEQIARANRLKKSELQQFNTTTRFKDFFFTNSGHPLQVGRPAFTVNRPNVLSIVALKPPIHLNQLFLSGTGDVLDNHSSRRLRLLFICKKSGTADVLVTVPVKSFSKVEFGFQKVCKAQRKRNPSGFLRTANSFMNLALTLLFVGMVYWSCAQLRSNERKAEVRSSRIPLRPTNFPIDGGRSETQF